MIMSSYYLMTMDSRNKCMVGLQFYNVHQVSVNWSKNIRWMEQLTETGRYTDTERRL